METTVDYTFGLVTSTDSDTTEPLPNTTVEDGPLHHDSYETISFIMAWLILLICIVGVAGNIVSIIIYTDKSVRSPINVLLTGLSAVDLCFLVLAVPSFVLPGFNAYYSTPIIYSITSYCTTFTYPIALMAQTAGVWVFVVVSFERWQAVCRPFQARWSSLSRSRTAVLLVCLAAALYNVPRFFEFYIEYLVDENTNETKAHAEYYFRNSTQYPIYMNVYFAYMFILTHFIIPFVALIILNALVIRTIWQSRQRRKALNRRERSEHRTAIMMIVVVATFLVCYTLMFILNICEAIDADFFTHNITLAYALNDLANLMLVANASSTFITYYFFSQKYRQLFLRLVAKYCKCILVHDGRRASTTIIDDDSDTRATRHRPSHSIAINGAEPCSNYNYKKRSDASYNILLLTPTTGNGSAKSVLTKTTTISSMSQHDNASQAL